MSDYGILAPAWAATGAADLVDDNAVLTAMLATEVALAEAQAELGVIPAGAAVAIRAAAVPAHIDLAVVAAGVRDTANPIVAFVEQLTAAVRSVDPSACEYVHRGSTSQDILDTALAVLCAATLDRIADDLLACANHLAGHVQRHRDTPMAGRTLTQHAVPVTFGLKAATWLHLVLDAVQRVRQTRATLPVSLGGAAGTLAAYHQYALHTTDPIGATLRLPALVAGRLGLAEPVLPWHGVRTPLADVAASLMVTTGALGKLAADVLVLSRTEIGEVTEEHAPGRGHPRPCRRSTTPSSRRSSQPRPGSCHRSPWCCSVPWRWRTNGPRVAGMPSGNRCASVCASAPARPPTPPASRTRFGSHPRRWPRTCG